MPQGCGKDLRSHVGSPTRLHIEQDCPCLRQENTPKGLPKTCGRGKSSHNDTAPDCCDMVQSLYLRRRSLRDAYIAGQSSRHRRPSPLYRQWSNVMIRSPSPANMSSPGILESPLLLHSILKLRSSPGDFLTPPIFTFEQ